MIISAEMTLISHTTLLANIGGIFIIIWSAIRGKKLNKYEIIGCLVAIAGCTVSVMDSSHGGGAEGRGVTISGDLLAIAGSLFGAVFMLTSEEIDPNIPSLVLTATIQLYCIITQVIFYKIYDYENFAILSISPVNGLFGWVDGDRIIFVLFVYGIISGFVSNCGMNFVLYYCSALLVNSVFMLEPFFA